MEDVFVAIVEEAVAVDRFVVADGEVAVECGAPPRSVLLDPPREGASLVVWLVPPIGLVMAGVLLYLALRGMQKSTAEGQDESLEGVGLSEEERAAYVQRIEVSEDWIAPEGEPSDSKVGEAT